MESLVQQDIILVWELSAERSCRCQLASCLILTFVLSRDELSARVITIVHNKVLSSVLFVPFSEE